MRFVRGSSLKKYLQIAEMGFTNRIVYFGDHLASSLFLILILFIFSQLWQTALGDGAIVGLKSSGMVWYVLFTEVIVLSTPATHRAVSEDVKSGDLAYKLVRPYSYPLYYFAVYCGEFLVRFVTNLAIGSFVTYLLMGAVALPWQNLGWIALGLCLAITLNFLLYFTLALLAFWLEDNSPFFWIFSKLVFIFGGLFVPVEAYPAGLRLVSYILPLRYGVSAPARLMVDFNYSFLGQMLAGQLIWILILGLVVSTMYRKGVRRVHVNGG